MTGQPSSIEPCRICGKPPGQKVGPPPLVRCVTPDCAGTKLAAVPIAEWNARNAGPEAPRLLALEAREAAYKARIEVLEGALVGTAASLAATISLLERTPKAKMAAPSNTMFEQMLVDYRKSLEAARAILQPKAGT